MRHFSKIVLFVILANVTSMKLLASKHFVSFNGTASWLASTGISTPCALSTANSNAEPGDTVYLTGGTYDNGDYIRPANSGTSETARITYSNYDNETVTIRDASYGIYLYKKSYITAVGIHFENLDRFMRIYAGHYNTIGFCKFNQRKSTSGEWAGAVIADDPYDTTEASENSTYNRVHHCTFSRFIYGAYDEHRASLLDIGNGETGGDDSYYNLVEDNVFFYGGHHTLGIFSKYNVIRNNYFHNESWDYEGYRDVITQGIQGGWCLYEKNNFAFAFEASGFSLRTHHNVIRFNEFYNNGLGGIQVVSSAPVDQAHYNHIYNNDFFHNGHGADYAGFSGGIYFCDWGNGDPIGNVVKNNIFYDNKGGAVTYDGVPAGSQIIEKNWDTGNPFFVYEGDGSELDPFGTQPDFRLNAESECIDSGGPLTFITNEDGSGTRFEVEDADYFTDGWGIAGVPGDEIQLEGTLHRAKITDVDYETDEITIDQSLSWTQGQGVCLAYVGNAPDIGAHEYGADSGIDSPLKLLPNLPNPFNRITVIPYVITEHGYIKLVIYDLIGREIKILTEGYFLAGTYSVQWDGTDSKGKGVPNGAYFYQIRGEDGEASAQKMIFLK
jgi:hypothetical protein